MQFIESITFKISKPPALEKYCRNADFFLWNEYIMAIKTLLEVLNQDILAAKNKDVYKLNKLNQSKI